ncbi:hypothetical protein [Streptomyces sp. NPDC015350]|uniref:hypothetical protein n=1 Tax=Streptomyces sp. NPDC015350 TaxID=3364955 RepID=UPI003700C34D
MTSPPAAGGSIPAQDIDPRTLYSLRVPNDDYAPGRILETHRLWERRWDDATPYLSRETCPCRAQDRVVGFLAVTDRTVAAGRSASGVRSGSLGPDPDGASIPADASTIRALGCDREESSAERTLLAQMEHFIAQESQRGHYGTEGWKYRSAYELVIAQGR